jgi:N-acyl-D-amino-acid deacylase
LTKGDALAWSVLIDETTFVAPDAAHDDNRQRRAPHAPGDGGPRARNYGTFHRAPHKMARDEHVLTLEQAVNRMTGMPAARLGLRDCGCVRAGSVADVAIFDPATLRDVGTFDAAQHYS